MAAVQEVRITQPVARSSCAELQASLCSVESRVVAISPDQGAVRSAKSAGSNPVVHSARATASTGVRKLQPSTGRRCERPQDTLWSRLCSCATGPQVSRTRGRTERSAALCRMQNAEHAGGASGVAQKAQCIAPARSFGPAHPTGTGRGRRRHGRLVRGTCGRVPVLCPLAV